MTKQLVLSTHKQTLITRFLLWWIGGAIFVRHGVESGQHRRLTEALTLETYAWNRHDQRRDEVSAGSGGFEKAGGPLARRPGHR